MGARWPCLSSRYRMSTSRRPVSKSFSATCAERGGMRWRGRELYWRRERSADVRHVHLQLHQELCLTLVVTPVPHLLFFHKRWIHKVGEHYCCLLLPTPSPPPFSAPRLPYSATSSKGFSVRAHRRAASSKRPQRNSQSPCAVSTRSFCASLCGQRQRGKGGGDPLTRAYADPK